MVSYRRVFEVIWYNITNVNYNWTVREKGEIAFRLYLYCKLRLAVIRDIVNIIILMQ